MASSIYRSPKEARHRAYLNNQENDFPGVPALGYGAGIAASLLAPDTFLGTTDFNMENPRKYMADLVLSSPEISHIKNRALDESTKRTSKIAEDIKAAGAAGGNEAATQTNLRSLAPVITEGANNLSTDLALKKKQSFVDYLNLVNYYDRQKMAHESANAQSQAAGIQQGLGGLTQLLSLWSGGLL